MHYKFTLLTLLCLIRFMPVEAKNVQFSDLVAHQSSFTQASSSLHFVENVGQITDQYGYPRPDINARISSAGVNVYIGSGQMSYQWTVVTESKESLSIRRDKVLGEDPVIIYRMDVRLLGANKNATLIKEEEQKYYEMYFLPQLGSEGAKASTYKKIIYKDIYPSIDWVLYTKGGKMEYDFVIHPGGKVSDIRLQYEGTTNLNINNDGSFTAATPFGKVTETAPYSFQETGEIVSSRFHLKDNILQFRTGDYTGILTIDPAVVWASYFGGFGLIWDYIQDIAVNKNNEVYAAGETTSSSNIATTGAFQTTLNGMFDAFLFKLDSTQNMLWATYYGGPEYETIENLALDSIGNIFVGGVTQSQSGLSTTGSHQQSYGGGRYDLFMAKFTPDGNRLFCTYYGGNGDDTGPRLKILGSSVYLAGFTQSSNAIATGGTHQPNLIDAYGDAFLAKFDLNGVREWATYYGGEKYDRALSVAGDPAGNIYLLGYTGSDSGIATAGSHQSVRPGGESDHFLVKFKNNGIRQWGTYFGGPGRESTEFSPRNLDCDQAGNVYIASTTTSTSGIAMAGSHQDILAGKTDAYLVKFNSSGVQQWGTYFGGENDELFVGVTCKDSNNIYMSGSTESSSKIASANAIRSVYLGGVRGDVFLARFNHKGQNTFGSYYGGKNRDQGHAIAYDHSGYVYVGGFTNSDSAIATPGSYQDTYPGAPLYNAFIAKFCFAPTPDLLEIDGPDTLCAHGKATYAVAALAGADEYIWTLPAEWTGESKTNRIDITNSTTGGTVGVRVVRCEDTSDIQYREVYVRPANRAVITVDGFKLGTTTTYVRYQWYFNGGAIPNATDANHWVEENGDYTVVTEDQNGCIDTSAIYKVTNVGIASANPWSRYVSVYPNPAINKVYIDAPIVVQTSLYSLDGRCLKELQDTHIIDLSNYNPGIYLIHIKDKDGLYLKTAKVIKTVK